MKYNPKIKKPALFTRWDSKVLICIWPDGRIAKVTGVFYGPEKWTGPCYAEKEIIKPLKGYPLLRNSYGKYKNSAEAFKAFERYSENFKFIGYC